MPLHNADIAAIFDEIADLLEIEGANPFRVRAYRNAARTLRDLSRDVTTMLLIPTLLILFLLVRGMPVLLYRHDIPKPQQPPFVLFASVASLGLVVVITQIGLRARNMNQDIAQALIGAALLSSLVYPTLAGVLLSRIAPSAPRAASG